jgi:hypothetical protein
MEPNRCMVKVYFITSLMIGCPFVYTQLNFKNNNSLEKLEINSSENNYAAMFLLDLVGFVLSLYPISPTYSVLSYLHYHSCITHK